MRLKNRYLLPNIAECLDWYDDHLVYGHDLGVTVLSRIRDTRLTSSYPTEFQRNWSFDKVHFHLGKPVELVKMYESLIACVHYNHEITVINAQRTSSETRGLTLDKDTRTLGGSGGHSSYINSVDISPDGLIASTGDDRRLLIWDQNGIPQNFPLEGSGKLVKFWSAPYGDIIIVLEAGNKIRLLDYTKSEWILTIYPGQAGCCGPASGNVRSFFVNNDFLYVVGIGWWKKYDLNNVKGGCGFTQSEQNGVFVTRPNNQSIAVTPSYNSGSAITSVIGLVSERAQYIHDTSKDNEQTFELKYTLPSDEITAAAIRNEGDVLAIASGRYLTLLRYPKAEYPSNY